LYEGEGWGVDDKIFVRVGDLYMDLGSFSHSSTEPSRSGYYGESVQVHANVFGLLHNKNEIVLTIPGTLLVDSRLTLGWKIVASSADAGIDNVIIDMICTAP
jgi:hypothetical protein